MQYLKKSFTVAVSDRPRRDAALASIMDEMSGRSARRAREAKQKHEYINGGVMCQLCGLAVEAKIHSPEGRR